MDIPHHLKSALHVHVAPPLRAKFAGGTEGIIEGLASTYSEVPDAYGDVIAPGAFAQSLAAHKAAGTLPVMLWSHRSDEPIGHWLEMVETPAGLAVRGQLNLKTERGRQAFEHVDAKDVTGLSIGFSIPDGGRKSNSNGTATLTAVTLEEVSVVALPANRGARITGVKSLASRAELEDLLRGTGLPGGAVKKVVAGGWPALSGSEPDPEPNTDEIHRLLRQVSAGTLELRYLKGR